MYTQALDLPDAQRDAVVRHALSDSALQYHCDDKIGKEQQNEPGQ